MIFFLSGAKAAEDFSLCRLPSITYAAPEDVGTDQTRVEAQTVDAGNDERLRLSGDVRLTRSDQRLRADDVVVDKAAETIEARGEVVFQDSNYRLLSPRVEIDNRNERGVFRDTEFELYDRHARGSAEKIVKLDAARSEFHEIFYTSCDTDDRDWHLRAERLEIDDESGRGSATHTTIYFQEVPFLYLPYFQFPIDDRRMTGMLTPSVGYSDSSGGTLSVPVYLNLAPNYDMTATPVWFSRRGLQLNTENRYLFAQHRGQLDLSYLDDDEADDSRWFQQWRHRAALGYDVDADLLLAEVSDGEIFDDFDSLAPQYNNTRHLERRVRLRRRADAWNAGLMWQDYQTLNPATAIENRPYNRLPQLTFEAAPEPWRYGLRTPLRLELVEFERDDSITGRRNSAAAALEWSGSDSWYFINPELTLNYTDYRLDDSPGGDSLNRALPTFALDTGLIFERLAGGEGQWLQTLEPRLYFLHTPFEDQDDIPDFDTSLRAVTYSNLFRNNRFAGGDRIGDANQVTLGIASRIFDNASGSELMHLRTGQIFFLKDRRVSLDGSRDTDSKSDVITELDLWPNSRVSLAARLVYDQDNNAVDDRDLSINYKDNGFAANLGYYFTEDELEQALVSVVYPLNPRWTLVAKHHRSLRFERTVENLLGFSYESCCWGLKILAGQSGDEDDDFAETDNSIYFELTLKGLSQAGADIDARLREAIPGYEPAF